MDWVSTPSLMSSDFHSVVNIIPVLTCSAVTMVVGDRNQAVPLVPITPGCAARSASSKYRVMLTAECASCAGSMQAASSRVADTDSTTRIQAKFRPRIPTGSLPRLRRRPIRQPGQGEQCGYPQECSVRVVAVRRDCRVVQAHTGVTLRDLAVRWSGRDLPRGRVIGFAPKTLDQRLDVGIVRCELREPLRVVERGRDVAGIARERHDRLEAVTIVRMIGQDVLQRRHGLLALPGGMQGDRVDIGV